MVGGSMVRGHAAARVAAGVLCLVLAALPRAALASPEGDGWGGADLSVRLLVSPARAQPGRLLSYRAEVGNAGPGDAVLPVLTVRLPDEVDVLGADVAECLPGVAAGEVVCASSADVPAGTSGGVRIDAMVRPGARGPLEASATLSSGVVDDDETNNSTRTLTEVGEGTDLAVTMSRRVRAGRLVVMSAVVRNRGPRRVHDAGILLDTGGARLLAARGARCDSRPGRTGCLLRALGAGGRASLLLAFAARDRGGRAEATVHSARVGDRRPANNTARFRL
ncbi:hypothetical protein ACIBCT_03800 [Streptosporangium sp. NPDC050855]|uniref:hypothetical protein n=1 Tax=Streptosporangium sp. NPDC050855 TaxID=3366194 RepID=UPI0037B2B69C